MNSIGAKLIARLRREYSRRRSSDARKSLAVKPIHVAIVHGDILLPDRRCGIGRNAHELDSLYRNLGRSSCLADKIARDGNGTRDQQPKDNRRRGGSVPRTFDAMYLKLSSAALCLAVFRDRVARALKWRHGG